MTNRLLKILRATPYCVGLCLFLLPTAWLKAQPSFFNFSYNGPTTLYVGPTCSSMLQGNVPNPVVTSTQGFPITMSMFDAAASGFQYNDLFSSGTVAHVYWFVKDNMGHSHTYEYFINFVDNTPPTFDLTGIFDTLQFSSVVQVPPQTALPVTDNCTAVVSDTFYQTTPPDTCQAGTFTRTWKATDAYSNTAVYTQTIIIYKDTLPPLITGYPVNGSAPCEQLASAYPNWLAIQVANFNATDASGISALINNGPPTFPPGCKAPLNVKFWAIDNCQIQLPVTVTFTTSDTEGPVVIKAPRDTVAYCSQNDNELTKLKEWISTKAYSQVFDSCSYPLTYSMEIGNVPKDSAQVVSAFMASFSAGCSMQNIGNQSYDKVHGLVTVKFIAKDDCGNTTTMGIATFGAIDTLRPVITGANVTEQCGGGNDQTALQSWINAHGNATVVDDCSGFTWTNFTFTTSSGQSGSGNFNAGPYPNVQANNCSWLTNVTFRATDDCGNSNTVKLQWSIVDNQAPTITGLQPDITVYCPAPLPTVPAATISDNCDANVSITFSRVIQGYQCTGSYIAVTTWTATDDCNNSVTAVQNIHVSDTTRPVFTLIPPNQTFRCDTFVLPPVPVMGVDIMATDICSPVVSITTATNSLQDPDPAVCGHYTYDIIRTFTAMDECGNTQTATQTISVIDNLGPVPGGILDTTALCSALTPFPAPVPLATDACSGPTAPPVTTGQTPNAGTCAGQYTITVHWVASDVCGNTTSFNQLVHVIDTVPPTLSNVPANITVECNAIPAPPSTATFNAVDNCNSPITVALLETEIRNPDTTTCEHWTDYVIQREWTATDECGNSRTYTQLIQIEDTTPPAIVPPAAMSFPNDPGNCGAMVTIPPPLSLTDVCSDQFSGANIFDEKPLIQDGPGSPFNTPVASMAFQLVPPNIPPFEPVVASPTTELRILLEKADSEGPTEYFNIYDEKNNLLGTANTNSQCGNKTTVISLTPAQLNDWLRDGSANFTASPNGTGALACNPVCAGGKMTARLVYSFASSDVPIDLTYTLDGGSSQNFPPPGPTYLSVGVHTVVYTAVDCQGNASTASVQITINDAQPPSLTPPANITAYTGQNNCSANVALPFPAITENCLMSAHLSLSSAVLPLHFEDAPDVGVIAMDISPTLTGLIPNAVGTGSLKIRHKGDNAQAGEFFHIYDEAGADLGFTNPGSIPGECASFNEKIIPVSAAEINTWAMGGGSTFFYLETNRDIANYSDFISNCAPLVNGQDGISQVQVMLEYSYAIVNYAVKNAQNQTIASGTLNGNSTTVPLLPGNYTVMYNTVDNAGLSAMTSYSVFVRDSVRPDANCQPTLTIRVNPAGLPLYTLVPSQINNLSTDNCTPSSNLVFALSPKTFNCNQAGTFSIVTLTVTDSSGNSATCTSLVRVENENPIVSYDSPICEFETLQLNCTPPLASPNTFSYNWSGPGNFSSNLEDPTRANVRPEHSGFYCVTITGATGCTSSACVEVQLFFNTTPTLNTNGISFCPGQTVQLSTSPVNGQNVSYQWLVDDFPNPPIILGTTPIHNFTVPPLPPGNYTFYVKVFANGCSSLLSNSVMATLHPTPPADAEPEQILVCEGQPINFNSPTPNTGGLTYMWTGPGFANTTQNPSIPNAIKAQHEGIYILTTKQNGCLSKPDTVVVNINPKPSTPSLSGNVQVCEGDTVMLVCNVASGSQWIWTDPGFNTYFTDPFNGGNVFKIPNVDQGDEGNWRVIVSSNNCLSDESTPIFVSVQANPSITMGSNAPICKDSLLKLTANFFAPDPIVSWCWIEPNGNTTCNNLPSFSALNGASGAYQVIGATSFGCDDRDTVDVTIVVPPTIDSILNNAPICCDNNTAITLSALVTPAPFSYSWSGPAFGPTPIVTANPSISIGPGPNCTSFNGQYTLVVRDAIGCPSKPVNTGINMQEPPLTPLLFVNDDMLCAGDSVLLFFNNPSSGAVYTWTLPDGTTTTTTVPFLKINNVQPIPHTGMYTVIATGGSGACSSGISNQVSISVFPIPPLPTITSNSPVCEGDVLMLFGNTGGFSGVKYHWTGPAGFLDTLVQNPVRPGATLSMEGNYMLYVVKDGCKSPEASRYVDVVELPIRPKIDTHPDRICMDGPVNTYLNIQNPQNGMVYTWEDATSGIDLQSSTATNLSLGLPNVLALGPGLHTFRVFASTPDAPFCASPVSLTTTVQFDTIPAGINANAGLDRPACVDSMIFLTGSPNPLPGIVTGLWTQTGGPDTLIFEATTPTAWFWGAAGNIYTFQWSISNGACMNFSSDEVVITAQNPEIAMATDDIYACSPDGIQLHATQGISAQGIWTQSSQQANQFGIVIDHPTDPNTTISGNLQRGQNYGFIWNIGNPGCGTSVDPVKVFIYNGQPNAGSNQFVCNNEDCTVLTASPLASFETGRWTSIPPGLTFASQGNDTTQVCGLKPGKNVIVWTTNKDTCGLQSRDTMEVYYEIFPTAFDDFISVDFGDTAHVHVLPNDILPANFTVDVTIHPTIGSILDTIATGVYVYRPQSGFTGTEVMTYRVCNTKCPDACSFATVTFNVGGAPECYIPTVITPNNDGFNDQFKIPKQCTLGEGEAELDVAIFNQWGDLVFHAKPYLNDWGGTYGGQELPAGTYYYVVKLNDQDKPRSGFLLIQR